MASPPFGVMVPGVALLELPGLLGWEIGKGLVTRLVSTISNHHHRGRLLSAHRVLDDDGPCDRSGEG